MPRNQSAGRKPKAGLRRRVLIRVDEQSAEIFDRYSSDELSEVFNRALKEIFPRTQSSKSQAVLIRPQETITETICQIHISGRAVQAILPEKHETFRLLMRRFLYEWSGRWTRSFPDSVDVTDRAAEIANEILLAGFCIQIQDNCLKDRVINRSFVPEAFRIIDRCTQKPCQNWFLFTYPKHEDWFDQIAKLTASKYANGQFHVPAEHFAEVQDFAEIHDFHITDEAIALAQEARILRASAIVVNPERKTRKKAKPKIDDAPIEPSIPAHLRDDFED